MVDVKSPELTGLVPAFVGLVGTESWCDKWEMMKKARKLVKD